MILRDKGKLQTVVAEIEDTRPQILCPSLSLSLARCAGCGGNGIRVSSVSQVVRRRLRGFKKEKKKKQRMRWSNKSEKLESTEKLGGPERDANSPERGRLCRLEIARGLISNSNLICSSSRTKND